MKASDVAHIPDPHQRMVQGTRFLRWLEITQQEVTAIRDEALRVCVDERGETQQAVGDALGLTNQRVSQILKRARGVHEASAAPFEE